MIRLSSKLKIIPFPSEGECEGGMLTRKWLQEFAYGIRISPWTYLFSLLSVVIIAFLTLGFLSRRSARTNPAQILKCN